MLNKLPFVDVAAGRPFDLLLMDGTPLRRSCRRIKADLVALVIDDRDERRWVRSQAEGHVPAFKNRECRRGRLGRRFRFGCEAILIGDNIPIIGIEYEEPAQDESGERYRNYCDDERSRAPETPLYRRKHRRDREPDGKSNDKEADERHRKVQSKAKSKSQAPFWHGEKFKHRHLHHEDGRKPYREPDKMKCVSIHSTVLRQAMLFLSIA